MNTKDDGNYLVVNPTASLRGTIGPGEGIALPGDKSLSHRAALFASLANGESHCRKLPGFWRDPGNAWRDDRIWCGI